MTYGSSFSTVPHVDVGEALITEGFISEDFEVNLLRDRESIEVF